MPRLTEQGKNEVSRLLDDSLKLQRLSQCCQDINAIHREAAFDFVYVNQENFERYRPANFKELVVSFVEFKEG